MARRARIVNKAVNALKTGVVKVAEICSVVVVVRSGRASGRGGRGRG